MEMIVNPNEPGAARRTLLVFAETVLRPVVRILLRYGLSCHEFSQVARKLYVDVAMREPEFRGEGRRRQYKSRVACITGLSRKEVLRLIELPRPAEDPALRSSNRAARVLEGWTGDARYLDSDGAPLRLPFRAPSGRRSFCELAHAYSGDIPPRAVLDELRRAGACVTESDMEIRVIMPRYVAQPLDIDLLTAVALRISSALAAADNDLAVDHPSSRRRNALRATA